VESAIFLFTRRVLALFRVKTRIKDLINPIFFIRNACFDQSSGQPRVNPGKQEEGGAKKIKTRRVFFSRYLAANDGGDGFSAALIFSGVAGLIFTGGDGLGGGGVGGGELGGCGDGGGGGWEVTLLYGCVRGQGRPVGVQRGEEMGGQCTAPTPR